MTTPSSLPRPVAAGAWSRLRARWPRAVGIVREAGVYLSVLGLAGLNAMPQWQRVTAMVLLGGGALAIRRRWPLLAAALPVVLITWTNGAVILLLVLCYGAGYRVTRGHLYAWLAGFVAAGVAAMVLAWQRGIPDVWSAGGGQWIQAGVVILLGMLAGQVQAQRHALHAAWRERAEHAERDRAAAAERARLRERTRIAQEMHDALGHQLSLISLQAASLEVDAALNASQRETVRHLGASARSASDVLRDVVGALTAGDEASETLPPRDIDELIERARKAGMEISDVREGDELPLSTMTQHALYRVVQEGLTNAHKHAPGSPVTVTVRYEPDTLVVELRNRRPVADGPADPGGGQGLIGLRERVRTIGGLLRAGPDGDDYRITAILPCQADITEPDLFGSSPGPEPATVYAVPAGARGAAGPPSASDGSWTSRFAVAFTALVFAASALLSASTSSVFLSRTLYDSIQVGRPEREVMGRLPRPLVVLAPDSDVPPPEGADCLVYSATRAVDAEGLDDGRYRLCFRDGTLVEKREFQR